MERERGRERERERREDSPKQVQTDDGLPTGSARVPSTTVPACHHTTRQ